MVFRLAFRNVLRNLPRLRPVLIIFVGSFLLLTAVNALLNYTQQTFSRSYVDYVTADAAVTERTETSFTLFGSDTILVGEYLEPPVIADPDGLSAQLRAAPQVADHAYVVTSPVRLEYDDTRIRQMAFGVVFSDYLELLPELTLLSGSWPTDGSAAVVVQEHVYRRLFDSDDLSEHLGTTLLLAAASSDSFTLREASLSGVYRYPVRDQLLDAVVLADAGIVRALAGYLTTSGSAPVPEGQESLFGDDVDDLFGGAAEDDLSGESEDSGSVLEDIDGLFSTPVDEPAVAPVATDEGAWNFALVRAASGTTDRGLVRALNERLSQRHPYQVLDWRQSIGGNVLIVYYVRILANIGILFVALAAIIITTNALVLSVLERTKEIGTMRAIGAQRTTVSQILALETLYLILGAAILGVILGALAASLINALGIEVDNQYLRILFGGPSVRAAVTLPLVLQQIAIGVGLALIALVYPLVKLLRLAPIDAVNA